MTLQFNVFLFIKLIMTERFVAMVWKAETGSASHWDIFLLLVDLMMTARSLQLLSYVLFFFFFLWIGSYLLFFHLSRSIVTFE